MENFSQDTADAPELPIEVLETVETIPVLVEPIVEEVVHAVEGSDEGLMDVAAKGFEFFTDPNTYQNFFNDTCDRIEVLVGEENYSLLEEYALPVSIAVLAATIIFLLGYWRGRASKESVLESAMMKAQVKIFKTEKRLISAEKAVRNGKKNRKSWNFRFILLLVVLELSLGAYFYFFHNPAILPSVPHQFHYLLLVIILIVYKFFDWWFASSIARGERNFKHYVKQYEPLKDHYRKLMEENNHTHVMQSIKNIEQLKNRFQNKKVVAAPPSRVPVAVVASESNLPKPKLPPADSPKPGTPERLATPVRQANGNIPKYMQRAPPLRATPSKSSETKSSGLFGSVASLISGTGEEEDLICEFCSENNGSQPIGELKQFECNKCKKRNGFK